MEKHKEIIEKHSINLAPPNYSTSIGNIRADRHYGLLSNPGCKSPNKEEQSRIRSLATPISGAEHEKAHGRVPERVPEHPAGIGTQTDIEYTLAGAGMNIANKSLVSSVYDSEESEVTEEEFRLNLQPNLSSTKAEDDSDNEDLPISRKEGKADHTASILRTNGKSDQETLTTSTPGQDGPSSATRAKKNKKGGQGAKAQKIKEEKRD